MTDAATASSRTMKGRNMVVVFFSRAGENYEVGEVTVGNTAKLAQEVARRTDSPMIEIARTEPYPERYAATSEMVQEEQRVNVRLPFTLSGGIKNKKKSALGACAFAGVTSAQGSDGRSNGPYRAQGHCFALAPVSEGSGN